MRFRSDRFGEHPAFQTLGTAEIPPPVPTEREIGTIKKGQPVYRAVFEKL